VVEVEVEVAELGRGTWLAVNKNAPKLQPRLFMTLALEGRVTAVITKNNSLQRPIKIIQNKMALRSRKLFLN
tara:strand:- start:133 stop:348 length:216 start_codon:yes stop_codon:yes gene_type:complete